MVYCHYISKFPMINQLITLGLSEKEAHVYVALLELGPSTMLEIAAKAEINRPTAYFTIESLKKRGLVSTVKKGKKTLFAAEEPGQLRILLDHEKRAFEEKKDTLASVLPDLESLFRLIGEKPEVRFFEGKEGLLRMQEEFLSSKAKEILSISSVDDVLAIFPGHRETYVPTRVKYGIRTKLIYTSQQGAFLRKEDDRLLRESKFIPQEKLPYSVDLTIYNNKIAIAALRGKLSGAIIEHKEIADSFRALFHFIWNII